MQKTQQSSVRSNTGYHCSVEETIHHFFLVRKKYDQRWAILSENMKGKYIKKFEPH